MVSLFKICTLVIALIVSIAWVCYSRFHENLPFLLATVTGAFVVDAALAGIATSASYLGSIFIPALLLFLVSAVLVAWFGANRVEYYRALYFVYSMLAAHVVVRLITFRDLLTLPVSTRVKQLLVVYRVFLARGTHVLSRLLWYCILRTGDTRKIGLMIRGRSVSFIGTFFWLLGEGELVDLLVRNREIGVVTDHE